MHKDVQTTKQNMIKHYLNLTNGVQQLPLLPPGEPYGFVRIQSTTLEQKNWNKLFYSDIDHDMLMHLALGYKCFLYDRGTKRPRSKTVYMGVPIIEYVLNRCWFDLDPGVVLGGGRHVPADINMVDIARRAYAALFCSKDDKTALVRSRLRYYKKFVACDKIDLVGVSYSTDKDGDYAYHRDLTHKFLLNRA